MHSELESESLATVQYLTQRGDRRENRYVSRKKCDSMT